MFLEVAPDGDALLLAITEEVICRFSKELDYVIKQGNQIIANNKPSPSPKLIDAQDKNEFEVSKDNKRKSDSDEQHDISSGKVNDDSEPKALKVSNENVNIEEHASKDLSPKKSVDSDESDL